MTRPPLELYAEVETASGARFRWDANQAPGSRLRNLSFSTKIGEGFSSAQGQLARRIDLDYPDLNLVDSVILVGGDGSTAFEGRISALPRELSDKHSIGVTLTGWMSHAKDRKFSEVYVDRDMNAWQQMSAQRRANLLPSNWNIYDPQARADPTNNQATLSTFVMGDWVTPFKPLTEAWYDAGAGNTVGVVYYAFTTQNFDTTNAGWAWSLNVSTDDIGSGGETSGSLRAVSAALTGWDPASITGRFASIQFLWSGATPSGSSNVEYSVNWTKLAVYGNAPVTRYTGEPGEPPGVRASEVISDIATRFCPELDTSGVMTSDYVIQHLAFRDRVFPYDAFLEINKYHLWSLGVWDNRTLHFRPYDLTTYDWEVRTDDPGTTFAPQGPSVDDLFNGVVVTYSDALTGTRRALTPDTFSDLADTDPENPWNRRGIAHWDEIELSTPTIQAQALQLGRAALADRNTPKTPGTITVQGYIRDRAGHEQPVWKVRAGDTISVTNFPNDTPRLIVETSYDDERKEVSLSIDRPFALLDAYIDRLGTALTAKGLT